MTVHELIEELKKCPQNAIVMYDFENAFTNDETERVFGFDREKKPSEFCMSVNEVMIGEGTIKGFVFLRESLMPIRWVCEECCNCHWYCMNNDTENECVGQEEKCEEYTPTKV